MVVDTKLKGLPTEIKIDNHMLFVRAQFCGESHPSVCSKSLKREEKGRKEETARSMARSAQVFSTDLSLAGTVT